MVSFSSHCELNCFFKRGHPALINFRQKSKSMESLHSPSKILMGRLGGTYYVLALCAYTMRSATSATTLRSTRRWQFKSRHHWPPGCHYQKSLSALARANNKLRTHDANHSARSVWIMHMSRREREMHQMSRNYWNGQCARGSRRTRGRKQQAFKWQLKPFQCFGACDSWCMKCICVTPPDGSQPRRCHLTAATNRQSKEDSRHHWISISAWMDALCICNS
jgi:hypothetical protein